MPESRKPGMRQHNFWLHDSLWDAARKRAADRGETLTEAVRKFLERYSR